MNSPDTFQTPIRLPRGSHWRKASARESFRLLESDATAFAFEPRIFRTRPLLRSHFRRLLSRMKVTDEGSMSDAQFPTGEGKRGTERVLDAGHVREQHSSQSDRIGFCSTEP
jgi:hypothetical protein